MEPCDDDKVGDKGASSSHCLTPIVLVSAFEFGES